MRKKKEVEAELNDKYRLTADSLNITLQEKKTNKKTGKEYWINIGYYSCFEHALDKVVELEIKEAWVKDLRLVVEKIKELEKMIRELRGKPLPELV